MPSLRNMRLQIRSVKNIAQVTKALEAVSASKVRKAQLAVLATRQYAAKALQILRHLSQQPGNVATFHPLLQARSNVTNITIVLYTSDRGLCGAYNTNALRAALNFARKQTAAVRYVAVGRKGRDLLLRRKQSIVGEFVGLPGNPSFNDSASIGRLIVEDFLNARTDRVYLAYTDFVNMLRQEPRVVQVLPLRPEAEETAEAAEGATTRSLSAAYTYEPSREELLGIIIPRFTQLQAYQALLESLASEHAARMTAMRNATDNAKDLISSLQLDYNKARQLAITSDMLDIAGGAEAQAQAE
ncbi:MAG: ATP synthase F1 subunit gamma [Anaerolineales bacterium]